jgi:Uma2 family endonuclease
MDPATPHVYPAQSRTSQPGEPTWEVADFFPRQGEWTEADYLALDSNRLVELADGRLEVLPMPTLLHQLIVKFLLAQLEACLPKPSAGTVVCAPLPVRLGSGRYREPDLVYLSLRRLRETVKYPSGADLVIEVVSEGDENRARDLVVKRQEYAEAGIAEYWIVDPAERHITVLTLAGQAYREAGVYGSGQTATSVLLPAFSIAVDAVLAAGEAPQQ